MTTTTTLNRPDALELRQIGLFGALSDEVLVHLANTLDVFEFGTGARVFSEGDDGRELFVVLQGELEVLKRGHRGGEARVAMLGPHDWFGDMSVLDIQPRSASVRSLAPTRLLRLSAADLDQLYRHDLKSYAVVVLNLAREVSRRLRVADGILADLIVNVVGTVLTRRVPQSPPDDVSPG